MTVQRARNENGFTLLELVIAIFLLSIGLLATASMQEMALGSNSHANINTISTMVAQQVMDDLMSVELQPNSTVPNTQYWYTQFNLGAQNAAYNRFPPITTSGSVPAGSTNLQINGVGTFTATYTLKPNTPAQYITQVSVALSLPVGQSPGADIVRIFVNPVVTLTGYRIVPQ